MDTDYRSRYRYRQPGFFFPIALITAGIVWLLVNNGAIPVENLYRLAPFWPVLLIIAGLSLMFRRIWWPLNGLLWLVVAALVLWLLTTGSAFLPKLSAVELKHETLHETLGTTKSANVDLHLSIHPTTVHALTDSGDLIQADVYTVNGMTLDASGNEQKNVRLEENFTPDNFVFNPRIDQWIEASSQPWDIRLATSVPLRLTVDAGTGRTDLKLDRLKLESLRVNAGTGHLEVSLPQGAGSLPVQIDGGTGGITVQLPDNTPVEMTFNGGTGGTQINLPTSAGVQVDVRNGGLGGLNLPSGFNKVSGSSDQKEGVYQNSAFTGAKTPIKIILDIGTGGVTIH